MAYNVTEIKITSGNNNINISSNFTTGYTNTPSPYGTITITPKNGFTVENDLPVKVWVSYKSNGSNCDPKSFNFTIPGGGGGGGCDCTNVNYSKTSLSWTNGGTTSQSVTITPPNGCTISELDADFRGSGDDYFTTAKTTNQITVTPKNGITSSLVTDTLTISFKLTDNAQSCTKPISVSWKKATPVTCDCSSAPTLTYNGQTLQEPLTWNADDTNSREVVLSLGSCTINNIQAKIKETTLSQYFTVTGSYLQHENSITLVPNSSYHPTEDINATVQYNYKVNNTTDCTDWREFAIKWKAGQTPPPTEELKVSPTALTFEWNSTGSKTVTCTPGEGVTITRVYVETDPYGHWYVNRDGNTITVQPESNNPSNAPITNNLYIEYTVNGGSPKLKDVFLKHKTACNNFTPKLVDAQGNAVTRLNWDTDKYGDDYKQTVYVADANQCIDFISMTTTRYPNGGNVYNEYSTTSLIYDSNTKKHVITIRREGENSGPVNMTLYYNGLSSTESQYLELLILAKPPVCENYELTTTESDWTTPKVAALTWASDSYSTQQVYIPDQNNCVDSKEGFYYVLYDKENHYIATGHDNFGGIPQYFSISHTYETNGHKLSITRKNSTYDGGKLSISGKRSGSSKLDLFLDISININ